MKTSFAATRSGFALAVAAAAIAFAGLSGAQAAPFTNGSFEAGTFVGNGGDDTDQLAAGSTAMTGWTVTGHEIAWINGNHFGLSPDDGNKFLDLTSYSAGNGNGVEQSFDTVIGHSYTVSFDLGGGTGVQISASAGGPAQTFTGASAGFTSWELQMFNFVAGGSTTLLSLVGVHAVGDYIGLDHVQLADNGVAAAPLPASVVMFGTALLGLGLVGARRNKQPGNSALGAL